MHSMWNPKGRGLKYKRTALIEVKAKIGIDPPIPKSRRMIIIVGEG
jgi:hypothetical protein